MTEPIHLLDPDYSPCILDPTEHDCEYEPEACEGEPKWWTCRYYQTVERDDVPTEPCSFGCWDEPNCITGQPSEGWQETPMAAPRPDPVEDWRTDAY